MEAFVGGGEAEDADGGADDVPQVAVCGVEPRPGVVLLGADLQVQLDVGAGEIGIGDGKGQVGARGGADGGGRGEEGGKARGRGWVGWGQRRSDQDVDIAVGAFAGGRGGDRSVGVEGRQEREGSCAHGLIDRRGHARRREM